MSAEAVRQGTIRMDVRSSSNRTIITEVELLQVGRGVCGVMNKVGRELVVGR